MNKKKLLLTRKHLLYLFIVFFLYFMQTNTSPLHFFGIVPLGVIPAVVVIAMLEGEFVGGLYGMLGGLLLDFSAPQLFGLNTMLLLLVGVFAGMVVVYFMQLVLVNAMLLTAATVAVRGLFGFYFFYYMWGYEQVGLIFWKNILPEAFLTLLSLIPVFYLLRRIKTSITAKLP